MSDENDKERAARAGSQEGRRATPGPAPNAPNRGPAARTMLGLSPPQQQDLAAVRAGLSGHVPGRERDPAHARTEAQPAPEHDPSSYIADKLYMDPPSEVFARAQTQAAGKAVPAPPPSAASNMLGDTLHAADMRGRREPPPAPPAAHAAHGPSFVDDALHAAGQRERSAPHAAPRFVDDALRAADPRERPAPRSIEEAAQTVHEHSQPRAPAPAPALRTSIGGQAPEAWRNDVKRVAQRGATSASARPNPGSSAPGPGSLRLKLDATADDEDHYRGVPKSRVGAVLIWLVILCGLGAGAAFWFDTEGGVNAVVARVQAVLHGKSAEPPPSLTPAAPAANPPAAQSAAAGAAVQPPSAATPPASSPQPSAAAAPEAKPSADQAAQDKQARELADPSSAEPAKADAAKPDANDKQPPKAAAADRAEKPEKPRPAAVPRAARPAPPRHEPIIKVKPMGAAEPPPSSGGPPAPLDVPYVPAVPDPPAPSDSP